jgi:PhnB protein
MQFITLYTPDAQGPLTPQHMQQVGTRMDKQLRSGVLAASSAIGRREASALRVTLRDGAFTVAEAPAEPSVLFGASGLAITNTASKEAFLEELKAFMQAAGEGTCEAIALAVPLAIGVDPAMPRGVVPYLGVSDASAAIAFYKSAFAAAEAGVIMAEDGKRVMHAQLIINGGMLMFSDAFAEYGQAATPSDSYMMQLVLADGQPWWDRAVGAGCTVKLPFELAPWGDRYGQLRDPFGITWAINQPAAKAGVKPA